MLNLLHRLALSVELAPCACYAPPKIVPRSRTMALPHPPTLLPLPAPPPTALAGSSSSAADEECELHLWGVTSYDLSALRRRRRRGRRDKRTTARRDPKSGSASDDGEQSTFARGGASEEDLPDDDTVSRFVDLLALLLAILATLLGVHCGRESLAGALRWCRAQVPRLAPRAPRLADGYRRWGRLAAAALRRAAWQLPQVLAGRAAMAVWAGRRWDGVGEDTHGRMVVHPMALGAAAAGAVSTSGGAAGAGGRAGAPERGVGSLGEVGPDQHPSSAAELASGAAAPAMPGAGPATGPRPGPRLRGSSPAPIAVPTPGPTAAPLAAQTPSPAASDTSSSDLESWAASASTPASTLPSAPAAPTASTLAPAPAPASTSGPAAASTTSPSRPSARAMSAAATDAARSHRHTAEPSSHRNTADPSSAVAARAAAEPAAAAASYGSAIVGPVHPHLHAQPQTQPHAQRQLHPRAARAAAAPGVRGMRLCGIAGGRGSSLYRSTVHSLRLSLKVLTPQEQRQQQAQSTSGSSRATAGGAGGDSGRDSEVESPARPQPDAPPDPLTPAQAQAAQEAQEQMVASLAVAAVQAEIAALQRQHYSAAPAIAAAAPAPAAVVYTPTPLPPAAAAARAAAVLGARASALRSDARRSAHSSAEAAPALVPAADTALSLDPSAAALSLAPTATAPTSSLSSCGLAPSLAAGITAAAAAASSSSSSSGALFSTATTITTTAPTAVEPVYWTASDAVELPAPGADASGVGAVGDSVLGRMSYPSRSGGDRWAASTSVGGLHLPHGSRAPGGGRSAEGAAAQGEPVGRGDSAEESAASGTEGFLEPPGEMREVSGSGGDARATVPGAPKGSRSRVSDAGGPGGGPFSSEGSNDVQVAAQPGEGGGDDGGEGQTDAVEEREDAARGGRPAERSRAAGGGGGGSGGSDGWGLVAGGGDAGGSGANPRAVVTEVTTLPGCVRLLVDVAVALPPGAAAAGHVVVTGWETGEAAGAGGETTATDVVGAGREEEDGQAAAGLDAAAASPVACLQQRLLRAAAAALRGEGLVVVLDGEAAPDGHLPPLPPPHLQRQPAESFACWPDPAAWAAGPNHRPGAIAGPAPAAALPGPWAPPWQDRLLPLPPVLPLSTGQPSPPVLAATPVPTGTRPVALRTSPPHLQLPPPPLPLAPRVTLAKPPAARPWPPQDEGLPQKLQRLLLFAPWERVYGYSLSSLRVAVTAVGPVGAPEPPTGCCGSGSGSGQEFSLGLQLPSLLADCNIRLPPGEQGMSPPSMGCRAGLGGDGADTKEREEQQGQQRQGLPPVLRHPSVKAFLAANPHHAGVTAAHGVTVAGGSGSAQCSVTLAPATPAPGAHGAAAARTCTGAPPGPSCCTSGVVPQQEPWWTAGSEVGVQNCAAGPMQQQQQQEQQRRAGDCVSVEVVALHVCGEAGRGQGDGDGWAEGSQLGSSSSGLVVEIAVWEDMQQHQHPELLRFQQPALESQGAQGARSVEVSIEGATSADAAAPRHVHGGAAATPAPRLPLPQLHIHLLGYLEAGTQAARAQGGLEGLQVSGEVLLGSVSVPLLPPPAARCLMELWAEQLEEAAAATKGVPRQRKECAAGGTRGGVSRAAAVGQGGTEEGEGESLEAVEEASPLPPLQFAASMASGAAVASPDCAAGQGEACGGGGGGTSPQGTADAVAGAVAVYSGSFGPMLRDLRLRLQLLAAQGTEGRCTGGELLEEGAEATACGAGRVGGTQVALMEQL